MEYRWKDKDKRIDLIRTVIQDSGKTIKQIVKESNGQIGHNTIAKWLYGETLKPQAYKMDVVLHACGYKLDIVEQTFKSIIEPTPYTPKSVSQKEFKVIPITQARSKQSKKKRMGAAKYAYPNRIREK